MPIRFACTICRSPISVSRQHAGKVGRCGKCKATVSIPRIGEPGADVSASADDRLVNTLDAPGANEPDDGRLVLEVERAKLELARAQVERDRAALAAVAAQQAPAEPAEIECPACAEIIKARAQVCRFCGHDLGKPGQRVKRRSDRLPVARSGGTVVHHHHYGSTKSPGVAAVLAFLWPGAGHIYAGQIAAGLMIMFVLPGVIGLGGLILVTGGFLGGRGVGGHTGAVVGVGGAYLVWLLAYLAADIWQIYDAYSACTGGARPRRPLRRRRRGG